jgi:hypothetical protein
VQALLAHHGFALARESAQQQRPPDPEPETPASGFFQSDVRAAFGQPPLQQDQPRFQIVGKIR